MKEIIYKDDNNYVELTGVVKNMPDHCTYIPRPLVRFDLETFRRVKKDDEEAESDVNRIIVFDDEDIYKHIKDGERVRVKGELQSRNFTRDFYQVEEMVSMAVKNYIEIWGKYPTKKEPKGKKRMPIDWDAILEVGLIPEIPNESLFKEGGRKDRESGEYIYRVDEDGEVFKETQHVAYEVVAKSVQKEESEYDPSKGDYNKAVLLGKITKQPYFDFLGQENKVAFCSFNIGTKSKLFKNRMFFNNVITWAKTAEKAFQYVGSSEYVKVVGRLQSREYQKEIIKRWKTPSGRKKKKTKVLNLTAREISATKVIKVVKKKQND